MSHIPAEQLALYASGDTEPEELRGIEEHLRDCRGCRDSLSEFRRDLTALRAWVAVPAAGELSAVRRGVIERLQKKQKFTLHWAWISAGAAVAVTIAGVIFFHPEHPHRANADRTLVTAAHLQVSYRSLAEVAIPNLTAAEVVRSRTVPPSNPAGIRSVTLLAEQDRPRILRMTTADPNVIILWQLNERTRRP